MTLKERGRILEILLVEDNPADARLVHEALKEHPTPYHLTVVSDGEAALTYLHQQGAYAYVSRPDIVLLDINLPGKNGLVGWRSVSRSTDMSADRRNLMAV